MKDVKKEEKKIDKKKEKRIRFHVIIVFFIIVFGIGIAPKALQNDTFYTVKIGEYISQNGISNLREDPFSWNELPYVFPHWLYDFMMYGIYSIGGWDAIYVSTICFTCILGISMYFTSNKISKNAPVSAVVTLIAMRLMIPYIAARAQVVTFSLFVLELYLIEKYLEQAKTRYAVGLLLFSLLIANMHMAVWPFFFVLFIPYIAEYIISRDWITIDLIIKLKLFVQKHRKNKDEEKIAKLEESIKHNQKRRAELKENPYKIKVTRNDNTKKLILVMLLCMLMGLFTPTGLSTPYTYLAKTCMGNTVKVINEHMPLSLRGNEEFTAFFVFFIVILTFIDIKIDLKHLLYYCGILYLALNARRQVSMFLVICTPILAQLIGQIFERYIKNGQEKLIDIVTNFYGKAVLLAAILIISIQHFKSKMHQEYYTNDDYPIYAAEWMKNNLDLSTLKLFNEYNYGSYLLYQGIPVMIDSRADLYSPEFNSRTGRKEDGNDIFMDVQNIATGDDDYRITFENYGINHIITYSDSRLCSKLKKNKNYKKIYPDAFQEQQDKKFVIFEKVDSDTEELEEQTE